MKFGIVRRIGETIAIALTQDDVPVSVFIWRDRKLDPAARYDDILPAIVRSIDKGRAEAFVELENGQTGYFNLNPAYDPPAEGARIQAKVVAEAYADKNVRVRPVKDPPLLVGEDAALKRWTSEIMGPSDDVETLTDQEVIQSVHDARSDIEASSVTLASGGQLHIERTRALTAIDVDTSGTRQGGGVNDRALLEVVRQVVLRRISGLVVIDVVGAPKGAKAKSLHSDFQRGLRGAPIGKADVLPVSAFGLVEVRIQRRDMPMSELSFETCSAGRKALEQAMLMLSEIQLAAEQNVTSRFVIETTPNVRGVFEAAGFDWQGELADRYGARFQFRSRPVESPTEFEIMTQ